MPRKRKRQPDPKPAAAPNRHTDEYARFLELHAKAQAKERHRVSLDELEEYHRLLAKYPVYTVDLLFVGPPLPDRVPNAVPILSTDCLPIAGEKPLICPRADPKPPPEVMPDLAQRWKSLRLAPRDQTVLWVGRQSKMDTVCMYHRGCACFTSARTGGTAETSRKPPPAEPPPDGTIRNDYLWLRGKAYHLTHELRPLLSYIILTPEPTIKSACGDLGYMLESHLHTQLTRLRKRLVQDKAPITVWSENKKLLWKWL